MTASLDGYNALSVWGILMRFGVNLFFLFILIRIIYFRYSKKEKFLFTFFLIGITVYFICAILRKVDFPFYGFLIINVIIVLSAFFIFKIDCKR